MNITLQYIILSLIIIAALIYMARGLRRKKGDRGGSCSGCAFLDDCKKAKTVNRNKKNEVRPSNKK